MSTPTIVPNLDLLSAACRLRFEGGDAEFHVALDAAYPSVDDSPAGLWDLPLPDDAPGDDEPDTGPSEISLTALRLAVDELTLPTLGSGPALWWDLPHGPYRVLPVMPATVWYAHPTRGPIPHRVYRPQTAQRIAALLNAMRPA